MEEMVGQSLEALEAREDETKDIEKLSESCLEVLGMHTCSCERDMSSPSKLLESSSITVITTRGSDAP